MEAIKIDNTGSVLIDTKKGFKVWVDIHNRGKELIIEWNKYIFFLDNPQDIKIKKFQENCDNFDIASSLAIEFYENHFQPINKRTYGQ